MAISRDKKLNKSNELIEQSERNFLKKERLNQPMSTRFRGYLPVIVDIETGGFNSQTDAILELGAVIPAWMNLASWSLTKRFFRE